MGSKASEDPHRPEAILPDLVKQIASISLSKINTEDETYRITTRIGFNDLLATIGKLGLLHPPWLIETPSGYAIVCGFRRIAACRQLGWQSMTASILNASADRFIVAQLAIADNALQRPLNLVETSRAINLLIDVCPNQQQLKKALSSLGLPTSSVASSKIQQVCRLPLPIQSGILNDTISLSMALELGKLDSAVSGALVELFQQLKIGLNRQRELLLLMSEIASREDIPIQQLIAEKPLQDLLQNTDLDPAVQRQGIRSYLRKRRYPTITEAQANFQKQMSQLKLGKHIQLLPPRDFEGTEYTMTLRFKNQQDLSDLQRRIDKILEQPALGKILKR